MLDTGKKHLCTRYSYKIHSQLEIDTKYKVGMCILLGSYIKNTKYLQFFFHLKLFLEFV